MGGWDIDDACPPLTQESWDNSMLQSITFKEGRIAFTEKGVTLDGVTQLGEEEVYFGTDIGVIGADILYRLNDRKKAIEAAAPLKNALAEVKVPDIDGGFASGSWKVSYEAEERLAAFNLLERPSWNETKPLDVDNAPTFLHWGGATHHIPTLIEAGWEFKVKHNRFMNDYRLVATIPEYNGGKLYTQAFKNLQQMEVKVRAFVPNKMDRMQREIVKEELLYTDFAQVPTETLLNLLTERLKAETPVIKTPLTPPANPAVLDFLAAFEARQEAEPTEFKEAVNE